MPYVSIGQIHPAQVSEDWASDLYCTLLMEEIYSSFSKKPFLLLYTSNHPDKLHTTRALINIRDDSRYVLDVSCCHEEKDGHRRTEVYCKERKAPLMLEVRSCPAGPLSQGTNSSMRYSEAFVFDLTSTWSFSIRCIRFCPNKWSRNWLSPLEIVRVRLGR